MSRPRGRRPPARCRAVRGGGRGRARRRPPAHHRRPGRRLIPAVPMARQLDPRRAPGWLPSTVTARLAADRDLRSLRRRATPPRAAHSGGAPFDPVRPARPPRSPAPPGAVLATAGNLSRTRSARPVAGERPPAGARPTDPRGGAGARPTIRRLGVRSTRQRFPRPTARVATSGASSPPARPAVGSLRPGWWPGLRRSASRPAGVRPPAGCRLPRRSTARGRDRRVKARG